MFAKRIAFDERNPNTGTGEPKGDGTAQHASAHDDDM